MPQANTGATLSADLVSGLYSGSVTCVATAAQIHRCSRKSTPSSVCGEKTQKPKSSGSLRTVLWLFRWDQHSGSAVFIVYSSQLCQYSSRSWCEWTLTISLGQLTNELDFLLSEGPDPSVAQQHRETLLCLQSLIHCKLNQATEELLKVRAMLRCSYETHFYFNAYKVCTCVFCSPFSPQVLILTLRPATCRL